MYRKMNEGWLKHVDFMILDMISLEISFFLAFMIRHGFNTNPLQNKAYFQMFFVLIMLDFVSIMVLHTFSGILRRGVYAEAAATFWQAIAVTLLCTFYLFTIQEGNDYSRITLYLTGILYFFISFITRCLWRENLKRRKKRNAESMVIITTTGEVNDLLESFKQNSYARVDITGIVFTDVSLVGEKLDGINIVADKDSVEEYMLSHWVDEVFLGISVDRELVSRLEKVFLEMGITVHMSIIANKNESPIERNVEHIGGYTVLTRSIRMLSGMEMFLKRTLDIIGGVVGCIITGILFLFVGPAIYKASPGPVIFTQKRIGKNGKVFKMYKFRSMYLDAEERKAELMDQNRVKDGFMFKLDYDPRIIESEKGEGKGIGNFIRRTSIDEFPQFLNVLKGDMSLVGTRPPTLDEWKKYKNHHRARMATKPGITGMWQISGRSNITDFEEIVDLDMQYIENWSFGLDLKILLKTCTQIFHNEGAM